jgi:hypothetical protein
MGTLVIAAVMVFQVKVTPLDFWAVARYNALVLPAVLLANTLLGYGFISAHRAGWNLSLAVAGQIFAYQVIVLFLSKILLRQQGPNLFWAFAAFALMAFGVAILSSRG